MIPILLSDNNACSVVICRLDGYNISVSLADLSKSLRLSGLEQLLDSWKTLCDIAAGYTSGVERSHCQLSTRLTDRLSSNDANCLTREHCSSRCEVPAVALSANSTLSLTSHDRSDLDSFNSGSFDCLGYIVLNEISCLCQAFTCLRMHNILSDVSACNPLCQRLNYFLAICKCLYLNTFIRSAVVLCNDYTVRDIYKPPCQISGIRCTQRCIRKSLTRTVG